MAAKRPASVRKTGSKKTAARKATSRRGSAAGRKATKRAGAQGRSQPPILIVAGEHSGDLLGASVVRSLARRGYRNFFGTGAGEMESAGVELLETVDSMEVIGFVEAFRAYRRLKRLAERLAAEASQRGCRHAILIDYPGFNLRLAEMLAGRGIETLYLVSPQIWAWNYRRIEGIRRTVRLMLTLFPFEQELYERAGVRAECIGHPMVERIPRLLRQQEPIRRTKQERVIGLLPGSRGSEVLRLFPEMLRAAQMIAERSAAVRFLVPLADKRFESFVAEQIARYPGLPIEYVGQRSLRVMQASDLVLLASGTATLETAYFATPMVVAYRVGAVNFLIASLLSRTRYIALVNLLARRQVAAELLQAEATGENMAAEALRLLEDAPFRQAVVRELNFVRASLGKGNPATKAAQLIDAVISES